MLLRFAAFRAATGRRVLLPAVVAVASMAAAAPAASALELGLQDDGVFLNESIGQRTQAFDVARQLGATHIRSIIYWDKIAGAQATLTSVPRRYRYDFRALDSLAAAADARGIKLQLVLTGKSPAYATADHRVGNFKPSPKLYAAWVKTVVARYRGRGYRYSLWNEPNFVGWLKPLKAAPQLYRGIVSAGYAAAKRADPAAQILVAELASFSDRKRSIAPVDFLNSMRCLVCTTLPADGFAYHPYDLTHPPGTVPTLPTQVTLGSLPRLFKALDRSHVFRPGLPVYLTEWGYATSGPRGISPAQQATYTAEAFRLAAAQPRVRQLMQYGLYTRPGTSFDTGIITTTGVPLPALKVLKNRSGR